METIESFRACEFSKHLVACVKQVQEQVCSICICLWAPKQGNIRKIRSVENQIEMFSITLHIMALLRIITLEDSPSDYRTERRAKIRYLQEY